MKRLFMILLSLSMILGMNTIVFASDDVKIKVNGTLLQDAQAVLKDGSTLLPVRSVGTALGGEVTWDNATKTASIDKDGTFVSITIGQKNITVNGTKQTISTPAQVINGRTYVPLRALGEALDCDITWVNATKTVEITQQVDPSEYKVWYEVDELGRIVVKTNINSNGWNGYTIVTALELNSGRVDWDTEHRQNNGIIELHPRGFYSHHKGGTVIRSTEIYIFKGILSELTDDQPYEKMPAFSDKLVCQATLSNPITIKESDKPIQITSLHVSYDEKAMKETFTASIAGEIAADRKSVV